MTKLNLAPRAIEALTFLDRYIGRYLAGTPNAEPSADRAWATLRQEFTMTTGNTTRLGAGTNALFMANSLGEAILVASLKDTITGLTVEKTIPREVKLLHWAAAQPEEAYPLLLYVQGKAVDDGLIELRLSYSQRALKLCQANNNKTIDLVRVAKFVDFYRARRPAVKTECHMVLSLYASQIRSGRAPDENLIKKLQKFGDIKDEEWDLVIGINEPEFDAADMLIKAAGQVPKGDK